MNYRRSVVYTCIIMRLYFIRHGQSSNNALWDTTGSSHGRSDDPELTSIGKQQARVLASYLEHRRDSFGITHIYTSLMVRAVETAVAIGHTLRLPVHTWEDVYETGGIFQENDMGEPIGVPGKSRAEFEAIYPTLILPNSLNAHGWWNRPFEAKDARAGRAERFVQELLARHGNTPDRVAVISHGNFYRYTLAAILRMPDPDDYFFALNNTAHSHIDFGESGEAEAHTTIVYLNRTDHLSSELLT